jgi:glutamate 5-kinase
MFRLLTSLTIGTSSIVDEKSHEPLVSTLSLIVETAVKLKKDGHKVVIVSSGAIGVALGKMNLEKRPKHLPRVQVQDIKKSSNIASAYVLRPWQQ